MQFTASKIGCGIPQTSSSRLPKPNGMTRLKWTARRQEGWRMNAERAKVVLSCALFATVLTGLSSVLGGKHLASEATVVTSPPARLAVTSKLYATARPVKSYAPLRLGLLVRPGVQWTADSKRRDLQQGWMTACHRTLPFGTLVRVINLRNRKSVIVRINDRGMLTPSESLIFPRLPPRRLACSRPESPRFVSRSCPAAEASRALLCAATFPQIGCSV